jgi:Major Facilitator Superfamily
VISTTDLTARPRVGVSYRGVFALAGLLNLCSSAVFCPLARRVHPRKSPVHSRSRPWGMTGPARLILASRARPFLLMVLLGACMFTSMSAYQATFAASGGLSPSIFYACYMFYACYTLGVIVPRFTVTTVPTKWSLAATTTALLAGICLSLAGFLPTGHDPVLYAASSALLGVTYGLAYPLIQARAGRQRTRPTAPLDALGFQPRLLRWALRIPAHRRNRHCSGQLSGPHRLPAGDCRHRTRRIGHGAPACYGHPATSQRDRTENIQ